MQQTAVKIDNPVIRSIDREDVQITPAPRVRFRPVMPAEKAALAAGFEQLSDASRYRRFLVPWYRKNALSPVELRFFTEPDGRNHITIAAVAIDARKREGEGVAMGHLLRLPNEREVAELASRSSVRGKG